MSARLFELVRLVDVSKVSGVGVVAEGALFSDGSVALRWLGRYPATAVWPSLEAVVAVHGHHGSTVVRYLDKTPVTACECGYVGIGPCPRCSKPEPLPTNGRSAWEQHDDPEMTR